MDKKIFFVLFILFISKIIVAQEFTKEDIQWFEKNCSDVKTELKYEKNEEHHYCSYFFMSGNPILDSMKYHIAVLIINRAFDINGKNQDGNTVEYKNYENIGDYFIYKGKYYRVSIGLIPHTSLKGENYINTFSVMFDWYDE